MYARTKVFKPININSNKLLLPWKSLHCCFRHERWHCSTDVPIFQLIIHCIVNKLLPSSLENYPIVSISMIPRGTIYIKYLMNFSTPQFDAQPGPIWFAYFHNCLQCVSNFSLCELYEHSCEIWGQVLAGLLPWDMFYGTSVTVHHWIVWILAENFRDDRNFCFPVEKEG